MRPDLLINLQTVLNTMRKSELALADLYRTCGQIWPHDEYFWILLERGEVKHAQNMTKLMNIVLERPEAFEPGRSFKPAVIQTLISGIQQNVQKLKNKELTERKMLFISRDIEQSILECGYSEIVKSCDEEFQSLMNEIESDTLAHHELLNDKIKEWEPFGRDHTAAGIR
jgi:hypothetical protein